MKVHKLIVTVVDFDDIGSNGVICAIVNARYPNRCISPNVDSVETKEIGEWSYDHPLNKRSTYAAEINRLFGETP